MYWCSGEIIKGRYARRGDTEEARYTRATGCFHAQMFGGGTISDKTMLKFYARYEQMNTVRDKRL